MGVVEVQPGEEWTRGLLLEPGHRIVDHLPCPARDAGQRHRASFRYVELVEIRVESRVEAEFPVEHEGPDERTGLASRLFQRGGKRDVFRVEHVSTVVAHAVTRRQHTREDRGVRGKRQRRSRNRLLEQHAFAGDSIQIRRRRRSVAVRADPIPARRVEGDEQHVELIRTHAAWKVPQHRAGRCLHCTPSPEHGPRDDAGENQQRGDRHQRRSPDPRLCRRRCLPFLGLHSCFIRARASCAGLNDGSAASASRYLRAASTGSPLRAAIIPRLNCAPGT